MTPEQKKKWQKAISPLDYLDWHALTLDGVRESTERLVGLGAPGWATKTRASVLTCQLRLAHLTEARWLPLFALHSEVALAGLQVLYPNQEEGAPVYGRVLKHFLHHALWPFAYWPEIAEVCRLCALPETPQKEFSEASMVLTRVGKRTLFRKTKLDPRRNQYAFETYCLVEIAGPILYHDPETWWKEGGYDLGSRLFRMYRPDPLHGEQCKELRRTGPAKPLADLFLTALEAECPPPDWLPAI